jgi:hypothetical protein
MAGFEVTGDIRGSASNSPVFSSAARLFPRLLLLPPQSEFSCRKSSQPIFIPTAPLSTNKDAALRRVKARVDLKQWQMFDLYALKEWPPQSVAQSLGVAVATVYVTRHRISAALRKETKLLEKLLEQSAARQSHSH